jgi:CPA2 family monovalent cation:H+ antiporter-2
MHEMPLLMNFTIALAYALAGGLIARRVGLPAIVGYLIAGIALGPHTLGFRGDEAALGQLAEFGVILLMFDVGLHFSFRDLWHVRRIAIPGALLQMAIVVVVGYGLGRWLGFSNGGAWVLGIAVSVASTVVLMRALMDRGWLETPPGKVAIGWLVFEDLLTVAILVLLPVIASRGGNPWTTAGLAIGKGIVFVVLMLIIGDRVMPWLLGRIVNTRSRELFVVVALTVAVGTAIASASVFNVSIALGAFVAGVVVSDSPFSHQIGADLLPFREAFAVLFFVAIGMLVNPSSLLAHWDQVLLITFVIVVVKGLVSGLLGAVLPGPARAALVLAAGRSQIGEFSFIVGQTGLGLALITSDQYSLILAGAIVSITLNAFVFKLIDPAERVLRQYPSVWRWINRGVIAIAGDPQAMREHVIIVGCGRVGRHIAEALGRLNIPRLVVESDPARLTKLRELGVPVLFGDAGSSEILDHASIEHARAVVITLPDDVAALAVAVTTRDRAPDVRLVARASTWEGARRLKLAGVDDVVRPELEGGVEIVRRTLLDLGLPVNDVQRYADVVRRDGLDESARPHPDQARVLDQLLLSARNIEVSWIEINSTSPMAGRTIGSSALRTTTGASIVGIACDGKVTVNPGPEETLHAGDRVAILGTPQQIEEAGKVLGG